MKYKLFGKSGLRVSELCLGTMTFGEDWQFGANKEESRKVFDAFAAAGGNFIDTAVVYTNGTSEAFLGEFIADERDKYVVATKYTGSVRQGDINANGNARKNLRQSVEQSLKRMKTDYIDLLWVHAYDYITPLEETMRGLDELVRAGKVLYVGVSDMPAWAVARANTLAEWRDWSPFVGLQIEYSLIERTPERDLLPMARALGIAVTPWSPLASGVLTGKYNNQAAGQGTDNRRFDSGMMAGMANIDDRQLTIAQAVVDIANEIGHSPAQVALNWLVRQSEVGGANAVPVIPIIGARRESQLKDNIASADFVLSPEHLKRLHDVSAIALGFPHDFLQSPVVQQIMAGGMRETLDTRRDVRTGM